MPVFTEYYNRKQRYPKLKDYIDEVVLDPDFMSYIKVFYFPGSFQEVYTLEQNDFYDETLSDFCFFCDQPHHKASVHHVDMRSYPPEYLPDFKKYQPSDHEDIIGVLDVCMECGKTLESFQAMGYANYGKVISTIGTSSASSDVEDIPSFAVPATPALDEIVQRRIEKYLDTGFLTHLESPLAYVNTESRKFENCAFCFDSCHRIVDGEQENTTFDVNRRGYAALSIPFDRSDVLIPGEFIACADCYGYMMEVNLTHPESLMSFPRDICAGCGDDYPITHDEYEYRQLPERRTLKRHLCLSCLGSSTWATNRFFHLNCKGCGDSLHHDLTLLSNQEFKPLIHEEKQFCKKCIDHKNQAIQSPIQVIHSYVYCDDPFIQIEYFNAPQSCGEAGLVGFRLIGIGKDAGGRVLLDGPLYPQCDMCNCGSIDTVAVAATTSAEHQKKILSMQLNL